MKKFDWSEVTRSEEVEALRDTKVKIRILPLEHSKPKCESDGYKFLKPHSASSGSLLLSPSSNFFLFLSLLSTILFHQPVFYSLGWKKKNKSFSGVAHYSTVGAWLGSLNWDLGTWRCPCFRRGSLSRRRCSRKLVGITAGAVTGGVPMGAWTRMGLWSWCRLELREPRMCWSSWAILVVVTELPQRPFAMRFSRNLEMNTG